MKYNLYIDECGDNNLKNFDEQFPIFTLCGVIVSEEKREWLEKEVQALKEEFWGNQYTILHSRDIRKCHIKEPKNPWNIRSVCNSCMCDIERALYSELWSPKRRLCTIAILRVGTHGVLFG